MKEKILIALSDQSLATHLFSCLSKEGYTVSRTKTGEEALQRMQSENPDLALIDLVLPGKNGYEVLEEKTLDRLMTKIPVIIVSNSGSPIDMKRIPSTPAVRGYIIKSHVDPEEVLKKVEDVFGRIYLPQASEAIHSFDEKAAPARSEVAKKILWVEDDKFLSSILFKKFESSGHTVLKAADGEEALKILETETPDVIVMDILLPGLSGFDILQKIKMDAKFRSTPVMMLSNLSKPSDIEKAKALGAQKFLVKAAVSLDEIVKEIDTLLKI